MSTVFRFRAGTSYLHRLDPLAKFIWLLAVSLLAFGAYIAWIQIAIAVVVLATAIVLGRISPIEILQGTWMFLFAVVLCHEGAKAPCCTRDEGGPFGAVL